MSLSLTLAVTWIARRRAIFDIPNERSSHAIPTPRLGGIGVFGAFVGTGVLLTVSSRWDRPVVLWSLLAGSLLLFFVGLVDDLRSVPWKVRCAVQAFAVANVLFALSGIPSSGISALTWLGFWPIQLVALVVGIWIINVFNFMDGIDGIAGSETIFVCVAGGILWARSGHHWMASVLWVMAAAATGFLILNWPPARIFLGDCGSGVLGFLMAFNLLLAAGIYHDLFWPMLILPCVFIADASVTVLRRMLRKERWYDAHRSHAYQHSAMRWGHLRTTLGVNALNLFWVLPLTFLAFHFVSAGPLIAVAAFAPLVLLALSLNAGSNSPTP